MVAPLSSKDDAVATFDAMIGSFEVYDPKQVFEQRVAAIKAGRAWPRNGPPKSSPANSTTSRSSSGFAFNNKDVGYLRFDELEAAYAGYKGINFIASSRTFRDDGSIVLVENVCFWAYTKQPDVAQVFRFSEWQNALQETTFVGNAAQAAWTTEQGILQYETPPADHLHPDRPVPAGFFTMRVDRSSGNTRNLLTGDTNPRPQQWQFPPPVDPTRTPPPPGVVDPLPLPRILEYVWPRLVDLTKPDTHLAFTTYNSTTGRLGLRTLSVIGPDTLNLDGQTIPATKLLNEIDPGYTTLWVDNTGKILAMRSSDNTMVVPTTIDEMKRLWAPRLQKLPAGQDALGPATRSLEHQTSSTPLRP